jgi:hypothetical protein
MMEMRMAQQEELNGAHSEQIAKMLTQHQRTMENSVNASLSHLHQVSGVPPPPALLTPIGQTPLQLMPPANLGRSSKVYELPHSSAIGSQWMTEKDSKEEKEVDATILKVLFDIAAEETNKEDPLAATTNGPKDPAPATSQGSRAVDPTPTPATSEGFPAPALATSEGSATPGPATSEGSPTPTPATSEGSPAPAIEESSPATSEGSPAPAPAPAPDDPLHNLVTSAPSNTDEKEVEC